MYRRTMTSRLLVIAGMMAAAGIYLLWQIMCINLDSEIYAQYDKSVPRKVTVVRSYGDIFDRNGIPLVNREESYIAVINPDTADRQELEAHVTDTEKYLDCIDGGALFLCGVDCPELECAAVIPVKERYGENSCAVHITGYISDGHGVCGIEKAFDELLRRPSSQVELTYRSDADGNFLEGGGIDMSWSQGYETGVATSIDIDIQTACEAAMKDVKKGAAVVMDIKTGELCAVVSKPDFDPLYPEKSLNDPNSPFVNRAFSAYSVGSVFKLVTAGAAIEYGISPEYSYNCTGSVHVRSRDFDCHRFGGHGRLDMRNAVIESCNPYFIVLAQELPRELYHDFAAGIGFGSASRLANGISSVSGTLTSEAELAVDEERANFSFGQGRLTATPLQVTVMTAAIANNGNAPSPVLVHGQTDISRDSKAAASSSRFHSVMKKSTADKLKDFMIGTLYKENSAAIPEFTTGGGKTSTAQTGQFDVYGNEKLNCWFTGFFPADKPQYAVTVMIEEGVSGNLTCGPVFADIADMVSLCGNTAAKTVDP